MIYKTDNEPDTTIQTAVDEWNKSAGVELPENMATINTIAAIGVNEDEIIVSATDLAYDSFEIKAVYGNDESSNKIEAIRTSVPVGSDNQNNEESNEETSKKTYLWRASSFDYAKASEPYKLGTKYTHKVTIELKLNHGATGSNSPVFITIRDGHVLDDNHVLYEWAEPGEFISVNNAFTYREDMYSDGKFVFELKDPKNPETLIFEYKDFYYSGRNLTATMTTDDGNVSVPDPLSHGQLYDGW